MSSNNRPIKKSLQEYARGIAGGLLFSIPLLYTMEVWWHGFIADPVQLIAIVVVTYLLLLGYNRYAGMRKEASWKAVFIDSVEEMGLGFLVAFGVLLMLNRITFPGVLSLVDTGKVIVEAMTVSIGVSIGTAQLGSGGGGKQGSGKNRRSSIIGLTMLSLCGAILIASNVAPTQEIVMIGVEAEPIHVLTMALVSLFLSVMIVFFSDFHGSQSKPSGGKLYVMVLHTCIAYIMALVASAFALWFFGRFEDVSFYVGFAMCITLGVLGALGASAGRLLIK